MVINAENIKKGLRYLKNYGLKEFFIRLKEKSEPEEISYEEWYRKHAVKQNVLDKQRMKSRQWERKPLISICVPMYNTPEKFAEDMIDSLLSQSYENWELCIADASSEDAVQMLVNRFAKEDTRIKYKRLSCNGGIAKNTNAALSMAIGEYIGLLDHDDLLAPNALYEVAKAIVFPEDIKQSGYHFGNEKLWLSEKGEPDVIYTDEDKVYEDGVTHYAPHFKPDFSLDLLRSNNYITHFTVVKKSLADQIGGFHAEFDGAQDYDFIMRCVEQANRVVHIPKVLYHWRMHEQSTAANQQSKGYAFEAGAHVIEAHLSRCHVDAKVEPIEHLGFYRVRYDLKETPLVSIIIPNKDEHQTLDLCLKSIEKSSYNNFEIIIVENNSQKEETFKYYDSVKDNYDMPIQVVTWDGKGVFNYSAINNYGVSFAKGECIVLLNNDIEILTKNWLEEMLSTCQRKEVGIVGARLYYPDDTIQHAGIGVGVGGSARGIASNMLVGTRRIHDGYLHKAGIQLNYSATTAACLMIKKRVFDEVGGLEEQLAVAFNDVDLCLKVREHGYLIVYNPYVEAYHYESKSRGQEDSPEKLERFKNEIEFMRNKWNAILVNGDPYLNPNFSKIKCDYSLNTFIQSEDMYE